MLTVALADPAATETLARRIAPLAVRRDVLALWGGLGTGKTVFARALIRARTGRDEDVPSPTFTLVQTYPLPFPADCVIYHFDLYRITGPDEAWDLGFDEALALGISLIEWPDRLGDLLPQDRLDIRFERDRAGTNRIATVKGSEPWQKRLREVGLV
ncbi:MAG: tRNA (adenosine(37)-N6)-threonylcarbamoyltransferase complex ATPase subunit type 1 TsaE [Rhodospirillales bacterium]|nr:MAG: tRNA (adenosine(37)-N6)-threonylcarbamoyltransferase complex ATPase subunit type 1 TsaE [Rhodospirillales bacterium]